MCCFRIFPVGVFTNADSTVSIGTMDTIRTPFVSGIAFCRGVMLAGILNPGHQRVSLSGVVGVTEKTGVYGNGLSGAALCIAIVTIAYGKAVAAYMDNLMDIAFTGGCCVHVVPSFRCFVVGINIPAEKHFPQHALSKKIVWNSKSGVEIFSTPQMYEKGIEKKFISKIFHP